MFDLLRNLVELHSVTLTYLVLYVVYIYQVVLEYSVSFRSKIPVQEG